MKNILTIDVGTQSIRAAIVSQDGKIIHISQKLHEIHSPFDGWAQQSPDLWWRNCCEVVSSLWKESSVSPDSIAAVSACGQMHGPVGIDDKGELTTEYVQLWCDKRCTSQVSAILEQNDLQDLMRLTGNAPNTAWIGMKVKWEKENNRSLYDKTLYYLVPKDYINFKLTGVFATDHSESSASYIYDINKGGYSDKLARIVGVDIEKFPPIHKSFDIIGNVSGDSAALTGIPEETPVVAGGGDFPVSLLGFGIVGQGATADVTGTSSLLSIHSPEPVIEPALMNCRHVVDGWIAFSILDSGGLSMKWCKDLFGSVYKDLSYDEMIEMARQAPPGCDGLIFQPYLTGERRIDNIKAKGSFVGLKPEHSASHMIRSVMEGVAFTMGKDASIFRGSGLAISELNSVGGGTRNSLWNEIKSSILGVPVNISDEPEAGIMGAALLGAYGAGLISDLEESAKKRKNISRTIQPDAKHTEQYILSLNEFKRIYDHNLGFNN
jgi:xylulokinase